MRESEPVLYCVDMGTTRARAWITEGSIVWARAAIDAGVRDVAAGHPRAWLADRLRALLKTVLAEAVLRDLARGPQPSSPREWSPRTRGSSKSLMSRPPRASPISPAISRSRISRSPGAIHCRCSSCRVCAQASASRELAATFETDLMRGEETLCLGLLEQERLTYGTLLLNLGSHWKLIWFDAQKRIVCSHTRLTGELIHAIQAHTLLASSVPQERPCVLDEDWVQLGYDQAARSGLSRALFCTRLLALRGMGTGEQRLSFLYGCVIHGEMSYLTALRNERPVSLLLAGSAPLAGICAKYAKQLGIPADILSEDNSEQAYLLGLRTLYRIHAGVDSLVSRGAQPLPKSENLKE